MRRKKNRETPEATLNITALSHDGRGIGHIAEKTTFISGALPGETVKCKLTKRHSRYNEGEVLEVITPSPERITPGCQHFGVCGGCSMQHLNIDAQINFKQQTFLEQLKHFGQVEPTALLAPITGNPWHYRRKARLGVRYVRKKTKLMVGFREKFSHLLADIHQCAILHPTVGLHITDLSAMIAKLTQYEHIAQIEVAASDNETALIFRHLEPLPESDQQQLREFAQKFNFQIYLQPNPPEALSKLWPEDNHFRLSYLLPEYQLEMQFHPLDFTQINSEINHLMLHQALELLEPNVNDIILDLFCGLGNFTLPIARNALHVTGIEGSNDMVMRARENAQHNHINNTEFYASNLMAPVMSDAWLQKKYHKILLDPPRSGAQEIIALFPQLAPSRIVYVSCNPATLARDAKELVHKQGYQLKNAGIINMFPHTSHIEAIALFEK